MWFLVNFSTPFDNLRNKKEFDRFDSCIMKSVPMKLMVVDLEVFCITENIQRAHMYTDTPERTHVSSSALAKCRANSFAVAQNIYNKPHNMRAFLMCKVTSIIGHKLFRFRAWWCIGPLHMPNTSMMKRRERTSNP